ncbi:hypothetical protein [Paraburkholderia monticola]|uniref:hypothetical protein n=1 Tax=Paraburkholderia monticola TaxID=1399968 RepID=UPI00128FED7E|nr:hypothetical protein [Paraburkholderia monticola]
MDLCNSNKQIPANAHAIQTEMAGTTEANARLHMALLSDFIEKNNWSHARNRGEFDTPDPRLIAAGIAFLRLRAAPTSDSD